MNKDETSLEKSGSQKIPNYLVQNVLSQIYSTHIGKMKDVPFPVKQKKWV